MATHLHSQQKSNVAPLKKHQLHDMAESNGHSWDYVTVNDNANVKDDEPSLASIFTVTDETDSKELEIHRCLTMPANGVESDQQVDLVHLRRLAESPGGLKTMALRRLAWPKLVAAHQVLWDGPPRATTHQPPSLNSREIHRLVQRTKWSKYQITKSPKTFDELLGLVLRTDVMPLPTPRQSFADLSDGATDSSVNANSTTTNNKRIRRVSFDLDLPLDDVEEPSHRQLLQMAQDERQLLRKLLCHIYRCHPDAPLYDGLQNLIAVLWIVIESPSLTSITSLQLIQYQWRPQSPALFMKLLALWDPALHQHFCLHDYSHAPPYCIANSWIPHWFSNDIKDLDVLLRIWDILIVHPPVTIVYFSVALVVQFRDSLLRADQQPIFQAILHHLPSDGLEKYGMVEPILQRCCQALQDYPPESIFDSAPQIPEWVSNATAPTDDQVIQRLAHLRQGVSTPGSPNPTTLPMLDRLLLQPTSCMVTSTTEGSSTFPNDSSSWDETPCSTPESVRSVRTMFHTKETPKIPTNDIFSTNLVYKIGALCCVGVACVAVAYSIIIMQSPHQVMAISIHDDGAPPNVTADTFSSDNLDHSLPTQPVVVPVPCPFRESRAINAPTYAHLAWPDTFQITTDTSSAHSVYSKSALNSDAMALLQEYGGNMCHPMQGFNAHLQCDDFCFMDTLLHIPSPVAFSVSQSKQESNIAWLVEPSAGRSMTGTPIPFQTPKSVPNDLPVAMPQSAKRIGMPNPTRIGFDPSHVDVDHVDTSTLERPSVPRQTDKSLQPKSKPTRSGFWSNPYRLALGLGNFLIESTEAHLRGRRQAHTIVDNVHIFVRNQANGKNSLLDVDATRTAYMSKSWKPKNKLREIIKVIQKTGIAATTYTLEATAVRLDASRSARANASQLAATLAKRSKLVTEDSASLVYGHLLDATNTTLNSVGKATRAIARKGNRMAHQTSSVATRHGSTILRGVHGLTSKYANRATVLALTRGTMAKAGQAKEGRMRTFPWLKPAVRNAVNEDKPSRHATVIEALKSSIARHSGTVLDTGGSLLSQTRTVILQQLVLLWDQLAQTLPQLRMLFSSGRQVLEVVGGTGMSTSLLAALYINEGFHWIRERGALTWKGLGSLNDWIARRFLLEKVIPSLSRELRKILNVVVHEIFRSLSFFGEIGLHVTDIIEDAATSITATTAATIVGALIAGKQTYRDLENGGRNVLLASQFAWNGILVYLTLILSVAHKKIVDIGAQARVDTFGYATDGSTNEPSFHGGAIVAPKDVHASPDGSHDLQVWPPQSSNSFNVTKNQPYIYPSLFEVQPIQTMNFTKVKPLRRSRGAADVTRESLMKKHKRNVLIDKPLVLEEDFSIREKATLQGYEQVIDIDQCFLSRRCARRSRKVMAKAFKQESHPNFTEIHQRIHIQEIGVRTKKITKVLAHVTAGVIKTSSHFLDNLALRIDYLQSILWKVMRNRWDRMGMFRQDYLNLTLRQAEHSALLMSYNIFFVMIALIEVGKKEIQHSSERQSMAVQHVAKESWCVLEEAAALRKQNMDIIKEMVSGVIAKAKIFTFENYRS